MMKSASKPSLNEGTNLSADVRGRAAIVDSVLSLSHGAADAVEGAGLALGWSPKSSGSSGQPNTSLVFVKTLMESTIVTPAGSVLGPTSIQRSIDGQDTYNLYILTKDYRKSFITV